jgi:hypothetical protein
MTGCVACELDDKMPNCQEQRTTHCEGEERKGYAAG